MDIYVILLSSIFIGLSYLLGSIPIGLIVSIKFKGIDVREYGSGKTGTTNILRTIGVFPAVLVIILDILKGGIPIIISNIFFDELIFGTLGSLFVIIGHCWPVFASFKGGRGVASAFGGFVTIAPFPALTILCLGILIIFFTRYVSLASITTVFISMVTVTFLVLQDSLASEILLFAIPAGLLIEFNHFDNMKRLINGSEAKFGNSVDTGK